MHSFIHSIRIIGLSPNVTALTENDFVHSLTSVSLSSMRYQTGGYTQCHRTLNLACYTKNKCLPTLHSVYKHCSIISFLRYTD